MWWKTSQKEKNAHVGLSLRRKGPIQFFLPRALKCLAVTLLSDIQSIIIYTLLFNSMGKKQII